MILISCLSSAFIMRYDICFVAHRNEVSSEHWYPHIFQSTVCLVFIDKKYIYICTGLLIKNERRLKIIFILFWHFSEQPVQNFKASSFRQVTHLWISEWHCMTQNFNLYCFLCFRDWSGAFSPPIVFPGGHPSDSIEDLSSCSLSPRKNIPTQGTARHCFSVFFTNINNLFSCFKAGFDVVTFFSLYFCSSE